MAPGICAMATAGVRPTSRPSRTAVQGGAQRHGARARSTLALGELTISNTGPASSVLHYQRSGALAGYYPFGNFWASFTLTASAPVGEVRGGQSRRVVILANTNGFSLSMATQWFGWLRV